MDKQANGFLQWVNHHLLSCPIKSNLGIDCPGCGLQRSVVALFQGNVIESFKLYPPTIPLIFIVIFSAIHLKVDFKNGAQIIKIAFIAIAIIIVINYIYKIYNHLLI